MKAHLFSFLFLVLAPSLSYAVKVYKIVDENGNVTFSQVPPGSNSQPATGKVEELSVSTGGMSTVRVEFENEYCGEIRLPKRRLNYRSSSKHHAEEIMRTHKRWQGEMERLESRVQSNNNAQINSSLRTNNSSYQQRTDLRYQQRRQQDATRLRDLRCAINWADKKQDVVEQTQRESSQEKERLVAISNKLEGNLANKCGGEPSFDPSDPTNEARRKRWYNCSKEIMRDLKKVRARLSRM